VSKTTVIRYTTRPDAADENQELIEKVFAELAAVDPGGVRYAAFRLDDGTFLHVVTTDDDRDPLPGLSAFKNFQSTINDRLADVPIRTGAHVVGSYRLVAE
jgi:hypothetical protein